MNTREPCRPQALETKRLLLIDDDPTFCEVLGTALRAHGFCVRIAHAVREGAALAEREPPDYAIIDLVMPQGSGLELVASLCKQYPGVKLVVLTGYASIATAVEAMKLGATYYLTKPADADEIVAAFKRDAGEPNVPLPQKPLSIERLEWEHIQRTMNECARNVSVAARRLGMHRRTLQRKLTKPPTPRS